MQAVLDRQKKAYISEGAVSVETRIDRIDRAIGILNTHGTKLTEAMAADFGHRSLDQSKMTDIDGSIGPLESSKKQLRKWMRPEKRKTMFPLGLLGGRSRIEYQPLGVSAALAPGTSPYS
jgi:coniferyl-aldehyde dehydrogenase